MAERTTFEAIPVAFGAGTQVSSTSPTTTAATALPVTDSGILPRYVRVQANGAGYIKFGGAAVAATANDIAVNANEHQVFVVLGCGGFFAFLADAATVKCNVNPINV